MKIIKNNMPTVKPEWPKTVKCRSCGSTLEIEKGDLKTGDMFYSQREIDHAVPGFTCPCCNNFSAL
jgi:hypothetical protein